MRLLLVFICLFISFASFAQDLRSGGILKPEQANMDIRHYRIVLDVDPATETINGHTEIDLVLAAAAQKLIFDLTSVLTVSKIWVNGKDIPFTHEKNLININAANNFPAGKTTVKIAYGGKPYVAQRPPWKGGFQWTKDSTGNPWIAISCQGEGAQVYFPCKDHPSDEPNEGAELIITVPKGLVVAGPGLLKKTSTKGNKSTFHWETNYTINNYCILFNVGKYKTVTREYISSAGNKIPMVFYVLEENADKAPYHLEMLERSAKIFEKYFGEYPWAKEKIGIAETPHLGMEHQTMNAYGNKYKYQQVGGKDFDWLMHHEFGHEWWANKVSNDDWAHMWIQEGICSFGDALAYREMEGEESYEANMRNRARNFSGRAVVLADTADSDLAYTGDIYGKGAYFMHSLRNYIGDSIFFPTLMTLATAPEYTYDNMINTDHVEQLFSKATGRDLKPFFDFYLRTTNRFEILVKQTRDDMYRISLVNTDIVLPLEIETDEGVKKVMVDKKGVQVKSASLPSVDKKGFYYKRLLVEN